MKKVKKKPESCTASVRDSIVKVEENKRKAAFRNKNKDKFKVSKVDGCLIDDTIRCDYLVTKCKVASVLIELKGSDVEHACSQLFSAVRRENVKPLLEKRVGFLVICSKYPRFDTFVAKAKTRCLKEFGSGFHVIVGRGEFDIERVVEIDGPH